MSSKYNPYAMCALAASSLLLDLLEEEEEECPRKKMRSMWVRKWIEDRPKEGFYAKLLPELRSDFTKDYSNFLLRMSVVDFDELLDLVSPLIIKQDTQMRKAISPGERLAVTLRYLATVFNSC